jgi:hypothetical protein
MPASTAIAVSSLKAHTAVTDALPLPHRRRRIGDLQAHGERDWRVDADVRAGVPGALEPVLGHLPQAGVRGHRVADAPVPAADQVLGLQAADRMRRIRMGHAGWEDRVGPRPVQGLHGLIVEGREPDHR